jgi:Homing endonuclease associated repeat
VTEQLEHTRESLVEDLRRVARQLGKKSVSRTEFIRDTGISEWHVLKHFDSWNDFVVAAGLQPTDVSRIANADLLEAMRQAFVDEGGVPTRTRFRKACRYSDYVFAKRWGTWPNVLLAFRDWVTQEHPDFPFMDQLPSAVAASAPPSDFSSAATAADVIPWVSSGGRQYGAVLNFRGLQHAPINEQGVVFLFGMVALELGFIVESVATGFPDCEAKRQVSRRGDRWERVRIEFEYQSRNFHDHGHDPAQCDLVVCWEDNWAGCPIEVLELRAAVAALEA